MGYKSRTDYIQEARVLYNMEIFPGGGVTLKEDILRVNARLIPSIYFLVVYTTTGKCVSQGQFKQWFIGTKT